MGLVRISGSIAAILLLLALLGAGGCARLPENHGRIPSFSHDRTDKTRLGQGYRAAKKAHPRKSGFQLVSNGSEALAARVVLCDLAERGLDLQYYIYENDNTGKFLYRQLLAAADRGVRVRILLDDMNTIGSNVILASLDVHPNIEVRIFNPFNRDEPRALQYITRFGSVTKRMHNKAFIADNQVALVGGRNIGDRYFGADPNISFRDLDLLGVGPAVDGISKSFDLYWNSELSYPIDTLKETKPPEVNLDRLRLELDDFVRTGLNPDILSAFRESTLAGQIRTNSVPFEWGAAEVFFDHPAKIDAPADSRHLYLTPQLQPHFDRLESELIIVSPYFVPGADGVAFLADLVKRGVKVRVLTNSLISTDILPAYAGYAKFRKSLLQAGVELYEINSQVDPDSEGRAFDSSRASLHAKTFIFDRKAAFIGSLNFDLRSFYLNTEIGVLFHSAELAGKMADRFDTRAVPQAFKLELVTEKTGNLGVRWILTKDGRREVFDSEPDSDLLPQIQKELLSVLPIESQL